MNYQLHKAILQYNDKVVELPLGKPTFLDELFINFEKEEASDHSIYNIVLHPKQDLKLQAVELQFSIVYNNNDRIFCNGYQSWSESREYLPNESIPMLRRIAHPFMKYYGDYHVEQIERGPAKLHSWSYSYIRQKDHVVFFGSLNEDKCYTIIQHDTNAGLISVQKDCKDLNLSHSFPILSMYVANGEMNRVMDQYFEKNEVPSLSAPPVLGWTSWYHYYTDISEKILLENLDALSESKRPFKIFQIDDGYQTQVGDWLSLKESFPNGMASIANKIRDKGMTPGLWIAPFVCSTKSEIFKTKKGWLLKDEKGQPIKAGYNPLWGGYFYALDYYNSGVQDYLNGVFFTMLNKWGYGILKLDFLYAACLNPGKNKTRAQVMNDALEFLRSLAGDKLLLGCGVNMATSFGKLDYCRVGPDIHLKWEHGFLKFLRNHERVSTFNALKTVLGRWHLNKRGFASDPDVFILRKNKQSLTPTQQDTIYVINALLGDLLFTSDNVNEYDDLDWKRLDQLILLSQCATTNVTNLNGQTYRIDFTSAGNPCHAFVNLEKQVMALKWRGDQLSIPGFGNLILGDVGPNLNA